MSTLNKIESFILPHVVDFFKRLQEQSILTKKIIEELGKLYVTHESTSVDALKTMIHHAETVRGKNLEELFEVFITPVDKEAISRAYVNLDWVVMSIKHLQVELETYGISDLKECKAILDLLKNEMDDIHSGFGMLEENDHAKSSERVFNIVHYDNEIIKAYSHLVSDLLGESDLKKIITRKEILNQLKEISKRIRMCANDLEDMLFKMR